MKEGNGQSVSELVSLPVLACCTPASIQMMPEAAAEELAAAFKAIGHPIRLQMLYILAQAGGHLCVCEIETRFDIKQPTVSHHLRTLREAGLVESEQRGLYAYYRLRPGTLGLVKQLLERLGG